MKKEGEEDYLYRQEGGFSQALVALSGQNKNQDLLVENEYYRLVSNVDVPLRTANAEVENK